MCEHVCTSVRRDVSGGYDFLPDQPQKYQHQHAYDYQPVKKVELEVCVEVIERINNRRHTPASDELKPFASRGSAPWLPPNGRSNTVDNKGARELSCLFVASEDSLRRSGVECRRADTFVSVCSFDCKLWISCTNRAF